MVGHCWLVTMSDSWDERRELRPTILTWGWDWSRASERWSNWSGCIIMKLDWFQVLPRPLDLSLLLSVTPSFLKSSATSRLHAAISLFNLAENSLHCLLSTMVFIKLGASCCMVSTVSPSAYEREESNEHLAFRFNPQP